METNPWVKHFTDMAEGLVPYQRKRYTVAPQVGSGDIKIVTPTQAVVERAKMDAKRKIKDATVYKPKRVKTVSQSGGGSKKKKKKTKSNKSKGKSKPKKTGKKSKQKNKSGKK